MNSIQQNKTISEHAHVAKLCRQYLKKMGIKGRCRAKIFAGGDSVDVTVCDQPPQIIEKITAELKQYQYGSFDSMNDIYESSNSRNDIPQVKYLTISNEFGLELKQSAWDHIRADHASTLPKNLSDLPHNAEILDILASDLIYRVLRGATNYTAADFWAEHLSEPPKTSENTINSETSPDYVKSKTRKSDDDIVSLALEILYERMAKPGHALTSPHDTQNYLRLQLADKQHEVFAYLFLDNRHRILAFEELFRGTIDGASVYPREVIKRCLSHNAAAVIFAHNHPSGITEPSQADQSLTRRLKKALSLIDIRVLDHIIVGDDCTSFAERGLL